MRGKKVRKCVGYRERGTIWARLAMFFFVHRAEGTSNRGQPFATLRAFEPTTPTFLTPGGACANFLGSEPRNINPSSQDESSTLALGVTSAWELVETKGSFFDR